MPAAASQPDGPDTKSLTSNWCSGRLGMGPDQSRPPLGLNVPSVRKMRSGSSWLANRLLGPMVYPPDRLSKLLTTARCCREAKVQLSPSVDVYRVSSLRAGGLVRSLPPVRVRTETYMRPCDASIPVTLTSPAAGLGPVM